MLCDAMWAAFFCTTRRERQQDLLPHLPMCFLMFVDWRAYTRQLPFDHYSRPYRWIRQTRNLIYDKRWFNKLEKFPKTSKLTKGKCVKLGMLQTVNSFMICLLLHFLAGAKRQPNFIRITAPYGISKANTFKFKWE